MPTAFAKLITITHIKQKVMSVMEKEKGKVSQSEGRGNGFRGVNRWSPCQVLRSTGTFSSKCILD
jgi:hypothetical protein